MNGCSVLAGGRLAEPGLAGGSTRCPTSRSSERGSPAARLRSPLHARASACASTTRAASRRARAGGTAASLSAEALRGTTSHGRRTATSRRASSGVGRRPRSTGSRRPAATRCGASAACASPRTRRSSSRSGASSPRSTRTASRRSGSTSFPTTCRGGSWAPSTTRATARCSPHGSCGGSPLPRHRKAPSSGSTARWRRSTGSRRRTSCSPRTATGGVSSPSSTSGSGRPAGRWSRLRR